MEPCTWIKHPGYCRLTYLIFLKPSECAGIHEHCRWVSNRMVLYRDVNKNTKLTVDQCLTLSLCTDFFTTSLPPFYSILLFKQLKNKYKRKLYHKSDVTIILLDSRIWSSAYKHIDEEKVENVKSSHVTSKLFCLEWKHLSPPTGVEPLTFYTPVNVLRIALSKIT